MCVQVWERIRDWDGSDRKKHLEAERKQQEEAEMEACTFDIGTSIAQNPETGFGGRSAKLVKTMVANAGEAVIESVCLIDCLCDWYSVFQVPTSRFDALYNDARQRQLRIEQYQNWYPEDQTFNPDIGPDKYKPGNSCTSRSIVV